MSTREKLNDIAAERILILDGAMGTQIQRLGLTEADFRGSRFAGRKTPLAGCNDLLCLTMPDAIGAIHEAYLEAGADIIETCSFNSTAISLADYGLADLAYEISVAAAALARKAADKFSGAGKPRFVAGSIGPTAKSASLSPDINNPAKRGIYWDELEAAFYDNARGLLDGGADILLAETFYDTLNAKAALFAIRRLMDERNVDIPVIISATVSGDSGRLLTGQTLEAFCTSVLHASPWAVGLNCSFGAEKLLPHIRTLSAAAPCLVSAHPNAGLPNRLGTYDETPETMAALIEPYLQDGLLNIVGACCGSTPAHIAAIAERAARYKPHVPPNDPHSPSGLHLAGLEPLDNSKLTLIGEKTNVAGSKEFLQFISEEKYDETLAFTRNMIENGAALINIGMDDAMLDAEKSMCAFLDIALSDPDIAKVPVMIDSSRWNVIEAGLKRLQGKGLVNSINLKNGEAEFIRRALLVRRYGAAVVVMLIDEKGQAVSYERKIEIAGRTWRLLTGAGFPAEDIVFDPNVLAVGAGIAGHDSCALDFIRACSWIRNNCPGVQISGGISNLSFSFRGNNRIRRAMHSVFLTLAEQAGLSMAIVNPAELIAYDDIEENLRNAVEDVILNRDPNAADRLLNLAEKTSTSPNTSSPVPSGPSSFLQSATISGLRRDVSPKNALNVSGADIGRPHSPVPIEERIFHAMIHGLDDHIEEDVLELRVTENKTPLEIVEGPLMDGMKEVGKRFDNGTMYLPQIIRSARVMKKAVTALEPYMEKTAGNNSPKIVLATVKDDVHDIGKNIVSVILTCNGYQVIDLGVMVPTEDIIAAAEKEQAAMIGLSGLISPSLDVMVDIAQEMEKRRMKIPLLIGGAAASLVHTGLRIAPEYSGPVVYVPNAGKAAETVRFLLSDTERPRFLQDLEKNYREAAARHAAIQSRIEIVPLEAARANKIPLSSYTPVEPKITGIIDLNDYPLDRIIPYIDWQGFLQRFEVKKVPDTLLDDAKTLLEQIKTGGLLQLRGLTGIFPAASDGDDIIIGDAQRTTLTHRFCFLRNQQKKQPGAYNPCLADFVMPLKNGKAVDCMREVHAEGMYPETKRTFSPTLPKHQPLVGDRLGLFALSAGFGLEEIVSEYRCDNNEYGALLAAALANTLAEAFTEEIHLRVRREWWGYASDESLSVEEILKGKYAGIRPAFGYPACPGHEDKRIAFDLLEAEKRCGMKLTGSAMIVPAASVCGMFFSNPNAYYFGVGTVGEDQLTDWAGRKGNILG